MTAEKTARHGNIGIFIPHLACPHNCVFCDQRAISGAKRVPTPSEVSELLSRAVTRLGGRSTEIAFFGGSFTCLPEDRMRAYLEAAKPFVGKNGVTGIRLSTRPDGISPRVLTVLAEYGVTDIELGAQSMDDGVLALSGRGHTARVTEEASALIKSAGFSLVLQFMPGLPGDNPALSLETAHKIIGLKPDGVRIYPTVVIKGTELEKMLFSGEFTPYPLDTAVTLCADMTQLFDAAGITVLRTGLHSDVEPGSVVAGPYHPAFGELVRQTLYRRAFDRAMKESPRRNPVFYVEPRELSAALGQKKENLHYLEDSYGALSRILPYNGGNCDDGIVLPAIHKG